MHKEMEKLRRKIVLVRTETPRLATSSGEAEVLAAPSTRVDIMIANLDSKRDEGSALGNSIRRRIVGTAPEPAEKRHVVVLQAPKRVDGDEPVNEFDMEAIWWEFSLLEILQRH